jgi:UPF0148 protein
MAGGGQTKQEDEIMARHLLLGGKMLSGTCPACGCPLFEISGKTLCVVCRERDAEKGGPAAAGSLSPRPGESEGGEGTIPAGGGIRESLERAIVSLCGKAAAEEDPVRAKILMEAVMAGVDAYQRLSGKPGQR